MKTTLKWLAALTLALSVTVSCKEKPAPEKPDTPDPGPEVIVPDKQVVNLTVSPLGTEELTTKIEAYDDWTVEPDENYKWVRVSPTSGSKGKNTLTFWVDANDGKKEREAGFLVYQGKNLIYEIYVVQAKPEANVMAGDLEFLQAIVSGKLLGENGADTPEITDWFTLTDEQISAFAGFTFEQIDGKWTIIQIGESAKFNALPETVELPNLNRFRQNGNSLLAGKLFPKVWKTPKLAHIALSHTKITGTIPQGLADCAALAEMYFDDTDFYGALPHIWASKNLEVALIGSVSNTSFKGEDPYDGDTECPYLGYIVPETLDMILNSNRKAQGDCTQMKLGGVKEGHWLGFEEGWGQERYEKFDPAAEKGNKAVWSPWRLLVGSSSQDPDVWAWYFSNMGYFTITDGVITNPYKTYIPQQMLKWDQTVADAFTAAAKIAHDNHTPIDMTAFGKEPEVKHDDNIDKGNVVNVGGDFWAEQ